MGTIIPVIVPYGRDITPELGARPVYVSQWLYANVWPLRPA